MTSKRQYPSLREGPTVEAELESLYRRKELVERVIRSMEAYVRAYPERTLSSRKVA